MKTSTAMRGALALGISVAWLLGGSISARAAEARRPEVVGLSVVKPDPQSKFGQSAVLGRQAGVEIHFRLAAPDRFVVTIDVDPKKPFSVTDHRGKLLSTDDDNRSLGFFAEIHSDGHGCRWVVKAAQIPPADATHLRLQGNLLLICGVQPKTVSGSVPLKQGQQFQLGQIPVTITRVGKPQPPVMFGQLVQMFPAQQDDFKWGVRFETTHADRFKSIRDLKFLDSDGRPIKSRWRGSGDVCIIAPIDPATGVAHDRGYYVEYELATQVSQLRYRATCFQKLETETVPVDTKVGLGL